MSASSSGEGVKESESELSTLCHRLNPSMTVGMTDLASELKRNGMDDMISLSVGEPDFQTPERIANAGVQAILNGHTKYSPNAGLLSLRERIASKLRRENGIGEIVDPAQVVVTNGAKQAIAQTLLALCSEGDEVLVPSPFWVSYPEMAKVAGADAKILNTKIDENFLLTEQTLEASLTEQSKVLILCSPSNPTGSVYSREQYQALAKVVLKHPRLMVISDEIYEHIYYTNADSGADANVCSFASCGVDGIGERTITVNGFSKAFAMTGWRVGYLAAPNKRIASAAAKIQSQLTSGASSMAQLAACEALRDFDSKQDTGVSFASGGGEEVQAMVEEFKRRRDYACQRLGEIGGANMPGMPGKGNKNHSNHSKPDGAFYLFPEVKQWMETKECATSEDLCMKMLREIGVATVPGSAFGQENCIRLSYANSMDNLEKAFEKIQTWLNE